MIYVILMGRIGNQLFQYAMAEHMRIKRGKNEMIVFDDSEVIKQGWKNSLLEYPLENVRFVHDSKLLKQKNFCLTWFARKIYYHYANRKTYSDRYRFEKKYKKFFLKSGLVVCQNGYIDFGIPKRKTIVLDGYFQSDNYFSQSRNVILEHLNNENDVDMLAKEFKDVLLGRNSVCISIKVEHNVGSEMYDVCSYNYWKNAIDYMIKHVELPLFFVCSDNVEYVKENLFKDKKLDVIYQEKGLPVEVSLSLMSKCKHFIIGNTTYGWWAQYMSENENKMVIAPSKWMNVDMPIDIYQKDWITIEG